MCNGHWVCERPFRLDQGTVHGGPANVVNNDYFASFIYSIQHKNWAFKHYCLTSLNANKGNYETSSWKWRCGRTKKKFKVTKNYSTTIPRRPGLSSKIKRPQNCIDWLKSTKVPRSALDSSIRDHAHPLSSVGGVKTKEGSFPLPKKQGVAISETEVTQRLPERTVAGSRAVRKTF